MVYLFFGFNPWIALAVSLATYLFEIFIDMNYARFKWQLTFASSWLVYGRGRGFQYYRSEFDEMTAWRRKHGMVQTLTVGASLQRDQL